MTRFARAKGSKASNLKSPEDSTPWEVMKEQMLKSKKENEESKNREEAEKQRIDNYNNFLKEHKTQKRKATWCEFPEAQTRNKINSNTNQAESHPKKKKKVLNNQNPASQENKQNGVNGDDEQNINKSYKKKNKKKSNNVESIPLKINDQAEDDNVSTKQNEDTSNISQQTPRKNKTKKNKNKKQTELNTETVIPKNNSEKEVIQSEHDNSQKINNKKKNKNKKQTLLEANANVNSDNIVKEMQQKVSNAGQPSKKKKDKKGRKKPINDNSFQLIINTKEVQLIRYDGFPIMKKDAERLEQLKKSMIQKGIPKSEVQRTMKLERRRAEKALARLKREVCYNCRKGGHNLSDCPDLKSNIPGAGAADGVCFKCGSTEHRQFECKVQKGDKEFRFATCFICKEAGHIARQCPDNPKGLYPNGGNCKLCGDVTHLRKDCPTVKDQKEGTSIKLQTLNDDNIEGISQSVKQISEEPVTKKPKKITF
ncbi:jg15179 [Pararge aegeria aegeria]|uniref:Jg15179 protein n=2 Tax=Pararge aegeria TaxID=116150 RepID=A0A8S4SHQ1_9NEOP|nr:jg15179 [Pararge aegeria aegeria]